MEYYLMRKDDVVTVCDMSRDGQLISWSTHYMSPELAPLESRTSKHYLSKWWRNRQVPVSQGRIKVMLEENGIEDPGDYLLRNLGLSLIDYYWMKPVDSSLKWRDVNLFENDFGSADPGMFRSAGGYGTDFSGLTPNSSLRGQLEKSWMIKNGKRCLVKGNRGRLSSESINEVLATKLHKRQKYDNYTSYKLLKIKGKEYDYGCYSKAFTNARTEYVSAYAVITSEKKPNGMSDYEHLINVAGKHGIDTSRFRKDLEYQILTDYLLSNTDRHMENIGVLRDAETLKFIRMAPVFDTGRAFAQGSPVPYTDEEIKELEVNSFEPYESKLLDLVTDRSLIDVNRVLSPDEIYEMYKKDNQIWEGRIDQIIQLYEKKLKLLS